MKVDLLQNELEIDSMAWSVSTVRNSGTGY